MARFPKTASNNPHALKEAEDARVARAREKACARFLRFTRRRMRRILAKELPGAKIDQLAHVGPGTPGKKWRDETFSASLNYADVIFALGGSVRREHTYDGRSVKLSHILKIGDEIVACLVYRRVGRLIRSTELAYYPGASNSGISRSEFLGVIADAVDKEFARRADEKLERQVEEARVTEESQRSRNSLLSS